MILMNTVAVFNCAVVRAATSLLWPLVVVPVATDLIRNDPDKAIYKDQKMVVAWRPL